jgi:hypothetical protein
MKKILAGTMIAGLLLFGFAGQSMAAFTTGDLIQVVYDSTYEYATDLGSLTSLEAITTTTLLNGSSGTVNSQFTGTLSGTALAALPSGSNQLTVAYYVEGTSTATIGAPVASGILAGGGGGVGSINGGLTDNNSYYAANTISGTSTAKALKSGSTANNSFYNLEEGGGSYDGTYGNNLGSGAEAVLTGTGSVIFNLYSFNNNEVFNYLNGTLVNNSSGQAFEIETLDVGGVMESEIVAQSSVPIPPSMLLLAPGLLGLIGLRRKVR